MNNRIKITRKALDLSQEAFGERLGITGSGLSNIESGKRNVTEQMILAICREFNVNEEWLRTGDGGEKAIFENSDDINISAVATEFHLDTLSKIILAAYVKMDIDKRTVFNGFVKEISDTVVKENAEKARIAIGDAILNSRAPDCVKFDLSSKAASIFVDAFPYIGFGNVGESEIHEATTDEDERTALHAMLDDEIAKEKKQESQASSVKKSDVG